MIKNYINFINENNNEEEQEIIDSLLSVSSQFGVLRKLLSPREIKVANKLVKQGKMYKGVSDDKQKTVCYFPV
jgi:hypothetical protein